MNTEYCLSIIVKKLSIDCRFLLNSPIGKTNFFKLDDFLHIFTTLFLLSSSVALPILS